MVTNDDIEVEPIHLLIRFSDKTGAIADSIEAHQEVIAKHRAVWFGKMGKTLASKHVTRMNAQCKQGVATNLYLFQGGKGHPPVYRGSLLEISREAPSERKLIPPYYRKNGLIKFMRLWGKLSNIRVMPEGYLSQLYVAGSGSRVSDILHSSMAGLFIIKERTVGRVSVIYHSRSASG